MFIVFVIAWIGFQIMGVPMAIVMALLLGIFTIIPYLGGFIACIPLAIVTLMFGDTNLMLMSIIFAILDWAIVTTFVPAFIMSKRMNTRALVIVTGLIIGGALFGVVGMILSAPVVSVIMIFAQERLKVREARREHEEMVEAGIIDDNLFDVSEMLDMTQDTAYNVPVEKIEDDFRRLQSLKKESKADREEEKVDVALSTKTEKKQKVNKRELTKSLKKEKGEDTEPEPKSKKVFKTKSPLDDLDVDDLL